MARTRAERSCPTYNPAGDSLVRRTQSSFFYLAKATCKKMQLQNNSSLLCQTVVTANFSKFVFFQFLFFAAKAGYFGPTFVALAALYLQILNSSNSRILILIDLVFWQTAVSATYNTSP